MMMMDRFGIDMKVFFRYGAFRGEKGTILDKIGNCVYKVRREKTGTPIVVLESMIDHLDYYDDWVKDGKPG